MSQLVDFINKGNYIHSTGCWVWTGSIDKWGEPYYLEAPGKFIKVKKYLYELHHSIALRQDQFLCRMRPDCKSRKCINPEHLTITTGVPGFNTKRGHRPGHRSFHGPVKHIVLK